MWRALLWGTLLAAIAQAVLSNPGTGNAASTGTAWAITGLRRFLAPDVAGIPQLGSPPPGVTGSSGLGGGSAGGGAGGGGGGSNAAPNPRVLPPLVPPVPGRGQIFL